MIWFVDTSALVKRYIKEQGSEWFRQEIVRHDVLISQLTPIEMAAALSKRCCATGPFLNSYFIRRAERCWVIS